MIPRLYVKTPLSENAVAPLTAEQAHYLKNVMRRKEGDAVYLFNGADGEYAAEITELKKKGGLVSVFSRRRAQETEPDLVLYFAPVKRGPLETIVQKAVELGVASFTPVQTERTMATRMNVDRLQAIATEAAEQCGRLSAPSISAPVRFNAMLDNWPDDRRLMFCDESGDDESEEWGGDTGRADPALDALKSSVNKSHPWGILIGPEGGFTSAERNALRDREFVTPVTLGPRILRADTAAIAAITLWQAALGDWRRR